MNNLSWLIYAAGAFDGLQIAGAIIATCSLFGAVIVSLIAAMNRYDKSTGAGERVAVPMFRTARKLFILGFVSGFLAIIAPSRSTIMLIAASEIGETVIASQHAQGMGGEAGSLAVDSMRVLRKFINEQLEEKAE